MRVDTLATGLGILAAMAEQDSWGITELSERIGEHKSRTHRLVNTLMQAGLVAKDLATSRYYMSWGLAELVVIAGHDNILRRLVRPAMANLVSLCQSRVQFAMLKDGTNFVVETIDGKYQMSLFEGTGTRRPPYYGASGKILMAYTDAETRRNLIPQKLEMFTETSVTDRAAFESQLEPIRQRGFAISDQEAVNWVKALAVPVLSHRKMFIGALTIAAPVSDFPPEKHAAFLKHITATSTEIGNLLRLNFQYMGLENGRTPATVRRPYHP